MSVRCSMVLVVVVLGLGCAHDAKRAQTTPEDERDRRNAVLIDARHMPDAVIQRVPKGQREAGPPADMAELREAMCQGETVPVIFYQLVVGGEWHYYWLCSDEKPVRAMTPRGDKLLRRWLSHVEKRANAEIGKCAANSSKRMFVEQHDSGTTVRAYCDGAVVLHFPDGERKTFELADGSPQSYARPRGGRAAPATGQRTGSGSGYSAARTPQGQPPSPCPPCPSSDPKTLCKSIGKRAFWQGVRKACDKICPAIFKHCTSKSPNNPLCHTLSEHCATLPGTCTR